MLLLKEYHMTPAFVLKPVRRSGVRRLAKKGQSGYSRSVTWQMDTFCFAGTFKQHEKKHVEEIEENQANRANESEKTLYIAPAAGSRNVAVRCEYCQATDAHG